RNESEVQCQSGVIPIGRNKGKGCRLLGVTRIREWKSLSDSTPGVLPLAPLPTPQSMQHRLQLQEILFEIRNGLATKRDVAPFHIASNKVIEEIAAIVPSSVDSIASVSDWSEERRREFGPDFIEACTKFAAVTGMSMDTDKKSQWMLTDEQKKKLDQLPPTTVSTYRVHLQTGIKAVSCRYLAVPYSLSVGAGDNAQFGGVNGVYTPVVLCLGWSASPLGGTQYQPGSQRGSARRDQEQSGKKHSVSEGHHGVLPRGIRRLQ
ncbi:hypothetical protein PMAYCL1PPCAC_12322, partial [Pristionchus mayeri]